MRHSWKIGRVAGIDLFLHPTFLVMLAFIAAFLGGAQAVLLASAVFGCVVLHELGHALMARRFGIRTADITLYPIGGVARLERIPRAPGAELLIALAGPAVNVAIALGLISLRATTGVGGAWASTLAAINFGLAAFNLIPAFPMDGGRVLRALLTGWIGRARATEIAATIGQVLAVAAGCYWLVHLQLLPAFLALFIFKAAALERAQVREEDGHGEDFGSNEGVWTAPPGYLWESRGQGVWQLVPIRVQGSDRTGSWD